MKTHMTNFVDMVDKAYMNIYPVVCYSPGDGTKGRIYWPSTDSEFPKRVVLCDGDSLQHAFLYMSRW